MVSLKQRRQSGFTIVELLIVIVIIGILATLVIVTFSGVQQKARDTERKTDINSVQKQLEAFYANKGYYPALADLNDTTWRNSNDFRVDVKSLADPSTAATQQLSDGVAVGLAGTGANGKLYYYKAYTDANKTTACATTAGTNTCLGFTVSANLENISGGATYSQSSN